jgi:hypothetical protein
MPPPVEKDLIEKHKDQASRATSKKPLLLEKKDKLPEKAIVVPVIIPQPSEQF